MRTTLYDEAFRTVDGRIATVPSSDVPRLFRDVPLDAFGDLLLDVPPEFPNLRAFFPSMPPPIVQVNWTGNHGTALLQTSVAFVKTLVEHYEAITGRAMADTTLLDFGCGWGRLIRLLYKYVSHEQIYAVDPWDESIRLCRDHGVKAHLALSDYVPRSLPFARRFDLIYAYSVFTHLSEKTTHVALRTLRDHISDSGLLVLTIRPKEHWHPCTPGAVADAAIQQHDERGFAFVASEMVPIDGDVTFGDSSMSVDYFREHFSQWKLVRVDADFVDPYQVLLFCQAA